MSAGAKGLRSGGVGIQVQAEGLASCRAGWKLQSTQRKAEPRPYSGGWGGWGAGGAGGNQKSRDGLANSNSVVTRAQFPTSEGPLWSLPTSAAPSPSSTKHGHTGHVLQRLSLSLSTPDSLWRKDFTPFHVV